VLILLKCAIVIKANAPFSHRVGHFMNTTVDGGYIIVAATESFGMGDFDVWLIKLAADPVYYLIADQNMKYAKIIPIPSIH
jgi:hypothetical protein